MIAQGSLRLYYVTVVSCVHFVVNQLARQYNFPACLLGYSTELEQHYCAANII